MFADRGEADDTTAFAVVRVKGEGRVEASRCFRKDVGGKSVARSQFGLNKVCKGEAVALGFETEGGALGAAVDYPIDAFTVVVAGNRPVDHESIAR